MNINFHALKGPGLRYSKVRCNMMKSLALSLLSLTLSTMNNWALSASEELRKEAKPEWCKTHFRLELMSLDGEWESYVHYASEDGTAVMPYENCKKVTWFQQDTKSEAVQIKQPMTVGTDKSVMVGHQNGGIYHDFFGVLTVTMTQKPNSTQPLYKEAINVGKNRGTLSSPPPKMCLFYIGASGPAQPVEYAHGFHNATCVIKSPEIIIRPTILAAK